MKTACVEKVGRSKTQKGGCGEAGAKDSFTINLTKKNCEYRAGVKTGAGTGMLSERCRDGDTRFKILL